MTERGRSTESVETLEFAKVKVREEKRERERKDGGRTETKNATSGLSENDGNKLI
jgi:hypothetical protein